MEPPILDLACGDGLVSALTFGQALDGGCDLSMSQVQRAKARQQYRMLVLADARELPYRDSSYATVISNSSIEHILYVEKVLDEVARILRPNGIFVFTVPNPRFNEWFWLNWICRRLGAPSRGQVFIEDFNKLREHHNIFDLDKWAWKLEKAGLTILHSTEYFPFAATFVFSILEYLWKFNAFIPVFDGRKLWRKRINIASGILELVPLHLRVTLLTRLLLALSKNNPRRGSHLLIVAEKPRRPI
jgi:SAM-dependent methyltransferase